MASTNDIVGDQPTYRPFTSVSVGANSMHQLIWLRDAQIAGKVLCFYVCDGVSRKVSYLNW